MESVGDVLRDMKARGSFARPAVSSSDGPRPDAYCELCGGCGYVRKVEPGMGSVRVLRRDPESKTEGLVSVPYEHDVVCSCLSRPAIPPADSCGLGGKLSWMRLDRFDTSEMHRADWGQIEQWHGGLPDSVTGTVGKTPGFVFFGMTGTGKTHLAAALLHATRERGIRCRLMPEVDLLEDVRATYEPEPAIRESELLRRLAALPLVCLDDVGQGYVPGAGSAVEKATWYSSLMYRLLNERLTQDKPTILTTNLTRSQLLQRLGKATESRLAGFQFIAFTGRDRR